MTAGPLQRPAPPKSVAAVVTHATALRGSRPTASPSSNAPIITAMAGSSVSSSTRPGGGGASITRA